jgi:hypothetical protein
MSEVPKPQDPRTIRLKMVRLSFTDSLKDKKATVENGTPKHGCNLIIVQTPGDDKLSQQAAAAYQDNLNKIQGAIKAACKEEFGREDAWKDIQEDNPKRICFRKGERFKNKDGEVYKGYAGNWGLSASGPKGGEHRPLLLDRYKRQVEEKDILEVMAGGYYADVVISFFGTDKGGNGVFASIEAIRSRQEGERLGGGPRATADDFDDLEEDDSFSGTAAGTAASSTASSDFDGIG